MKLKYLKINNNKDWSVLWNALNHLERQTKDMIEFEKDNIKAHRDVLKIDNDYQYYFSDINASISSLSRYKRNLKIILKKMGELKQVYFDV
jgi:hypothetical protein